MLDHGIDLGEDFSDCSIQEARHCTQSCFRYSIQQGSEASCERKVLDCLSMSQSCQ